MLCETRLFNRVNLLPFYCVKLYIIIYYYKRPSMKLTSSKPVTTNLLQFVKGSHTQKKNIPKITCDIRSHDFNSWMAVQS